jgi:hypothetical protein
LLFIGVVLRAVLRLLYNSEPIILFLLAFAFSASLTPIQAPVKAVEVVTLKEEVKVVKPVIRPSSGATEIVVRDYFSDAPILADIAKCESEFRHYGRDGEVLRGTVVSSDLGVMQINEYYHGKTADALDIDIYSLEGNLAFAKYLFEREGTKPWLPSVKCWGSENHISKL